MKHVWIVEYYDAWKDNLLGYSVFLTKKSAENDKSNPYDKHIVKKVKVLK